MFSGYQPANFVFFVVIVFVYYFNDPSSARLCYVCASTFPPSQICLPSCSPSYRPLSTCLLTRNIPLVPVDTASLRAAHIDEEPILADAAEKNFLYGEEAVYLSPSPQVGWDWEYGAITYGCDSDYCNDPQIVNSLPSALNAHIPDTTLNQLLTGDVVSQCYDCPAKCINESSTGGQMDGCQTLTCPNHACWLLVSRSSSLSPLQCGNGWQFSSGCLGSREPAQIDMTLMHYIRSNTTLVYQMEANCLSDNCNSFSTFKQLKDAIRVRPDLACLNSINNGSTTSTSRPTSTTTPLRTSSGLPTTFVSSSTTRSSSSGGSTTSIGGVTTTAASGTSRARAIPMVVHVGLALLSLKPFF